MRTFGVCLKRCERERTSSSRAASRKEPAPYLDEDKKTDMPIYLPPPQALHGPTVGIYRAIGRNDEAVTSKAYAPSLRTSLEQICRSTFWLTKARFAEARQRLSATGSLAQGWDGYGSESPNADRKSGGGGKRVY